MPDRPLIALVNILQQHGLAVEALEDMVHFCERQRTGSLTLHFVEGHFKTLEEHAKRQYAECVKG